MKAVMGAMRQQLPALRDGVNIDPVNALQTQDALKDYNQALRSCLQHKAKATFYVPDGDLTVYTSFARALMPAVAIDVSNVVDTTHHQ